MSICKVYKCKDCPLKFDIHEHGLSGTFCSITEQAYAVISNHGVREDCPLKKEDYLITLVRKE